MSLGISYSESKWPIHHLSYKSIWDTVLTCNKKVTSCTRGCLDRRPCKPQRLSKAHEGGDELPKSRRGGLDKHNDIPDSTVRTFVPPARPYGPWQPRCIYLEDTPRKNSKQSTPERDFKYEKSPLDSRRRKSHNLDGRRQTPLPCNLEHRRHYLKDQPVTLKGLDHLRLHRRSMLEGLVLVATGWAVLTAAIGLVVIGPKSKVHYPPLAHALSI